MIQLSANSIHQSEVVGFRSDFKIHLPRNREQLPFWDKNKAFANLEKPVLYNVLDDEAERTDVAAENPNVVREISALAASARKDLGAFMDRGVQQRPTGSLFPEVPVISHEKDWGILDAATLDAIALEYDERYPNQGIEIKRSPRRKRK